MRRVFHLLLITLIAGVFATTASAKKPGTTDYDDGNDFNGNGAPSGAHYNLNIIGVPNPKGKTEAETGKSNGRRIFVGLGSSGQSSSTKIMLTEGDFDVIDYDGTDGTAIFQLPNPDPNCDGTTEYSVYARALGGPGGSATITTCADETGGGNTYCSTGDYVAVLDRGNGGKSTFSNVSRQLLYVTGDFDGGGVKRYPLFGDALYDYYWDYENFGLKLAQLRFYEIPTDVNSYEDLPTECEFPDD